MRRSRWAFGWAAGGRVWGGVLGALRAATVRLRFRCASATPDTLRPDGLRVAAPRVARQGEAWWGRKDSNLRSLTTADLQSAPFATRDTSPSASDRNRPPEWRRAGPWMTLRPKARLEPASTGAFMGEAGWQSQPTEPAKIAPDGPKLPYSGPRDKSSP